ncbi:MAG: hypothetical protein HY537_01220 [Deltaproteobacteria bacterium]|nr:hypothetical protein [Deltaproteobacteria bacterium]
MFFSPDYSVKDGQFTVTFDPPQKVPFIQAVELPSAVQTILEEDPDGRKAIFTIQAINTNELLVSKDFTLKTVQQAYRAQVADKPVIASRLKTVAPDPAVIQSLSWSELEKRKKTLQKLAEQAKLKEQQKKPPVQPQAATKPATLPSKTVSEEEGKKPVPPTNINEKTQVE